MPARTDPTVVSSSDTSSRNLIRINNRSDVYETLSASVAMYDVSRGW